VWCTCGTVGRLRRRGSIVAVTEGSWKARLLRDDLRLFSDLQAGKIER
jgi:hypothetical protein